MRTMKLCFAGVLVLALSASAWGVSAPPLNMIYNFFESTDHTNGNVYAADVPGTYTRNPDGSWSGPGALTMIDGPGTRADEDTWGIFSVKRIQEGLPEVDLAGNRVSMAAMPGAPDTYNWSQDPGDPGTGLVGMVYGGDDVQVEVRADGSFQVWTEDIHIELWAVDSTKLFFDAAETTPTNHEGAKYEVGRRSAANRYDSWLDPADLVPGTAIPLLSMVSEYQLSDGAVNQLGYFNGGTQIYADVVDLALPVGFTEWVWNDEINDPIGEPIFRFLDDRLGVFDTADVWLDYELKNDTGYDWLAKSNDDGGFGYVPEPMTMLGVFMGVSGLASYIQKRRRA